MTQTPTAHDPAQGQARAHFTVPAKHPMVTVLGSGDSLLRVIEKAFPAADIHVRGNEISAVGTNSCSIWRYNYFHDNNNADVPGSGSGLAGSSPVGTGSSSGSIP